MIIMRKFKVFFRAKDAIERDFFIITAESKGDAFKEGDQAIAKRGIQLEKNHEFLTVEEIK